MLRADAPTVPRNVKCGPSRPVLAHPDRLAVMDAILRKQEGCTTQGPPSVHSGRECIAFGCRGKYDPQGAGVTDSGHRSIDKRRTQQATGSGKDRRSTLCFRCQKPGHFAAIARSHHPRATSSRRRHSSI